MTKRCDVSVHINRPASAVYAYLADFRNQTEWRGLTTSEVAEGEAGTTGAIYAQTERFLGRTYHSRVEATSAVPDREVRFRTLHDTGMPVEGTFTITPAGGAPDASTVAFACAITPRGLSRLAEPLMGLTMARTARGQLHALRDALERAV